MKTCPKCGQKFMEEYNESWCPDCSGLVSVTKEMRSLGKEDTASYFEQDIGLRLQRAALIMEEATV